MRICRPLTQILLFTAVVSTYCASESRHTSNWAVLVRKHANQIEEGCVGALICVGLCFPLLVQLSPCGEHAFDLQERKATGHTRQVLRDYFEAMQLIVVVDVPYGVAATSFLCLRTRWLAMPGIHGLVSRLASLILSVCVMRHLSPCSNHL